MATIILALKTGLLEGGQDLLILALVSLLTVWPLWRGFLGHHKIHRMRYTRWIPAFGAVTLFLLGVIMLGNSTLATAQADVQRGTPSPITAFAEAARVE